VFSIDGLLILLLIVSVTYNLFFVVRLRRYHARLKYLSSDIENFVNETGNRIHDHDSLLKQVRTELKTINLESLPNSDVLTSQEKK
jgi:hypothetical protein